MRVLSTVLTLSLLLVLGACSSDDDDDGGSPLDDDTSDPDTSSPDDGAPGGGDTGDTTPPDDAPGDPDSGDPGSGDDGTVGGDGGATDGGGDDTVGAMPQLDADNYVSVVTTVLRLAREDFGRDYELGTVVKDFARFELLVDDPVTLDDEIACESGGAVTRAGQQAAFNADIGYVFDDCTAVFGTISGSANILVDRGGQPGGGFTDTLDVTLSDYDTGFGVGTVVVDGVFELAEQGGADPRRAYTIENYEVTDDRGELIVSGTGELRRPNGPGFGFNEEITADVTLRGSAVIDGDAIVEVLIGPEPGLRITGADSDGVSTGVITLRAGDGSSVVVAASGEETVANVTVRDGDGVETVDTRAWANFF